MGGRGPQRLGVVIHVAEAHGCKVFHPNKGSHWKFKKDGCRTYPIPAHNGLKTQIAWSYIQGLCRCMGIPEDAFLNN